jgi:hypothetical protein
MAFDIGDLSAMHETVARVYAFWPRGTSRAYTGSLVCVLYFGGASVERTDHLDDAVRAGAGAFEGANRPRYTKRRHATDVADWIAEELRDSQDDKERLHRTAVMRLQQQYLAVQAKPFVTLRGENDGRNPARKPDSSSRD